MNDIMTKYYKQSHLQNNKYKALLTVPLIARKQIDIHEQKGVKNLLIDKEKNKQKSPSAYFIIQ